MDAYRKEQMQDRRDSEYLAKPDPERIFLAPRCEGLSDEGRSWCEDRRDCDDTDCGLKAVEYVRVDLSGWQPIETAPKNRMLLVGFFNSLGKWRSMHAQYRDDLPLHDDSDDELSPPGWYEGSLEAETLFPVRPTHWQTLPAPPPLSAA